MRKKNPAQTGFNWEPEPGLHVNVKPVGSIKGHFIVKPGVIHLKALNPKAEEHAHCFDIGKGGSLQWDGSKASKKTPDIDLVTCPRCRAAIIGTSAYGALKKVKPQ